MWCAGLFEGEGSMSWSLYKKLPNSVKLTVMIKMTDKDVLEKFCTYMDLGKVKGPYKPKGKTVGDHWKDYYIWEVQDFANCLQALTRLYPYFGERRRAKADEMINLILKRRYPSVFD